MDAVQEPVPVEKRAAALPPPRRAEAPPAPGFSARLRGETLFDLIQFECLQRSSKIVRVTSNERSGFLYFRQGNVVHATQGLRVGEAAVRVLLRWDRGSFEIWDGPWPRQESITLAWQNLLLRATQEMDEAGAKPRVLSFPANKNVAPGDDDVNRPTPRSEPVLERRAIEVVKVTAAGEVVEGAGSTDLIERVTYAAQIADLLGELLGAGAFASLEVSQPGGACLVTRDGQGTVSAAASSDPSLDAAALRQSLGLPTERT
jgi:hypothetical protein